MLTDTEEYLCMPDRLPRKYVFTVTWPH